MADTVQINVVHSGARRHVVQLLGTSDGTGETAVIKVNKSDLANFDGLEPDNLGLTEAQWNIQGFSSVSLYWDHTTDDEMLHLSDAGYKDFRQHGCLVDPQSAGGTGDVVLTSNGAAAGATYDILLSFKLRD